MTEYDIFAQYYDTTMQAGGNAAVSIRTLQDWIERYHPRARTLLELGCGTGTVLEPLAGRYEATGIDTSAEMLAAARRKLPDLPLDRLVQADMASFRLGRRFDVVLCVFDSLNHLPAFDRWEATFDRVEAHLARGGLFIFDCVTLGRIADIGDDPPRAQVIDGRLVQIIPGLERPGVVDWTIAVHAGPTIADPVINSEHITETAFPLDHISQAVSQRFELLGLTTAAREAPSDQSERIYYICRRRSA